LQWPTHPLGKEQLAWPTPSKGVIVITWDIVVGIKLIPIYKCNSIMRAVGLTAIAGVLLPINLHCNFILHITVVIVVLAGIHLVTGNLAIPSFPDFLVQNWIVNSE
jgi:hypothetical protein